MTIRVIAYVDGYNLYYGLRARGWRRFYWLNVQALVERLLRSGQMLVQTKYFTTVVEEPADKQQRQAVFLEALQTLSDFRIYYGHFFSNPVTCQRCGYTYKVHHEKMTDVNITIEMLTDAFQDRFDMALLLSGDSDLTPVVRAVLNLFNHKRVIVVFPPERSSKSLKQAASGYFHVNRPMLLHSQFPDEIIKPDGYVLRRPAEWQ